MARYYYCPGCKGIGGNKSECGECKGINLKELKEGSSINLSGTKQKGKVFRMKEKTIVVLLKNEFNKETVREVSPEEIKKII